MKIQRNKKFKKRLEFYKNNFGFKPPYQILVDATFCFAALQNQVNIREQLGKLFDDNVKLLTTPCVITEVQNMGRSVYGAFLIVKQFMHHDCGHKTSVNAAQCLSAVVKTKNKRRLMIATQDRELRGGLCARPAVPVLYLHGAAPTLQRPVEPDTALPSSVVDGTLPLQVKRHVADMKQRVLGEQNKTQRRVKQRKKRGPNPLSCKRKHRQVAANSDAHSQNDAVNTKRRRRKRVRVAAHVRVDLAARGGACAGVT